MGERMSAAQIASFIREPAAPMPKVFPAPRNAEDEHDLTDVAAFVAAWPTASPKGEMMGDGRPDRPADPDGRRPLHPMRYHRCRTRANPSGS